MELQHDHRSLHEQQKQPLQMKPKLEHKAKQKKFIHQRSILKNSVERNTDEIELLEAKKQLILRRRRLFSHYRQYEQWRRRQFSYDPCSYRATPLPIGQAACGDYASYSGSGAFRRRRQYRRQFSCAERSREDSRESRESSSLHKYKSHSMVASDTINTDSPTLNHQLNKTERISEEHSASISERCTRSRINSAIFVSSEGRGFDSIEFLRRHGSQSVLCRKARSAENITDNSRKKSFSENKRQWCTDENTEESKEEDVKEGIAIELQECRKSGENRVLSVLKSNTDSISAPSTSTSMLGGHSAPVTTANKVVGSISIEAPPAFIKDGTLAASNGTVEPIQKQQPPSQSTYSTISSANSASHDSTDTVEELILVPATETKSRVLIHQCSSNASSSPHSSHKSLNLKGVKNAKPKISALPMVSVSGPSPTQENPSPTGCL